MTLKLQKNRFLREFSTFGIGGPIHSFAEITSLLDLQEAFAFARAENLPILSIGKGSNSLFPDRGFDGLALLFKNDSCEWRENRVRVGAGYSFSLLGSQSARRNLSGLEFASGIPASVGGAIFMNAGANKRETADSLVQVTFVHKDGRVQEYMRSELAFSYRKSPFHAMPGAIFEAIFELTPLESARKNQLALLDHRMKTQPLKEKSAGCVFLNPPGPLSAGALIEKCQLKGVSVGGAKVSEVHANFIINTGEAKASDVLDLIALVQERVLRETQIALKTEIQIYEPEG